MNSIIKSSQRMRILCGRVAINWVDYFFSLISIFCTWIIIRIRELSAKSLKFSTAKFKEASLIMALLWRK